MSTRAPSRKIALLLEEVRAATEEIGRAARASRVERLEELVSRRHRALERLERALAEEGVGLGSGSRASLRETVTAIERAAADCVGALRALREELRAGLDSLDAGESALRRYETVPAAAAGVDRSA